MFINKIMKNLSIKNFLVASILLSSIAINQNIKTSFLTKKKTSINKISLGKLITVSAGIFAIYILFRCAAANNRSADEADIIENFNNNHNFAQLEINAKREYDNKTWFSSDDSLESDYPAQWLRKDAESNKKYMKFLGFFSEEKNTIANRLHNGLNQINLNQIFRENKREFNRENRKQKYRDSKLREGKVRNTGAFVDLISAGKNLLT